MSNVTRLTYWKFLYIGNVSCEMCAIHLIIFIECFFILYQVDAANEPKGKAIARWIRLHLPS